MEKEFIPYEQALALKELGFDKPCFGKYLSSLQSNWKEYELILEMGMNEEFEDNRNVYFLEKACSAPTFSQAFRWFREKHNFDLVWKPISMVGITCYYDIEIHHSKYVWDKPPRVTGKTYEKAELECLKELIKIVKNDRE